MRRVFIKGQDKIAEYRKKKNTTQKELAKIIDMGQQKISEIENNQRRITYKRIRKICEHFDCEFIIKINRRMFKIEEIRERDDFEDMYPNLSRAMKEEEERRRKAGEM